ncbi:hypothetical protein BMS3Abin15_00264 [bacterium BMS3Abin15]|nr:hypothetical protein BMS3Abin15_00264 [bacterium BMS3Abin15]HDZ85714.1 DUF1003 domain-containing protein [Candidatus Moranbacteria bacterium]
MVENKNNKNNNNNQNQQKRITYNKPTLGDKSADKVTKTIGSWKFIIIQTILIIIWIIINVIAWISQWDPYPFILLNLLLSVQAAFAAPVIMMSQNRMADKDRKKVEMDLAMDRKADRDITEIKKQLNRIENKLGKNLDN